MVLPQFAHAHNLSDFKFLPVLNIDCFLFRCKGVSHIVSIGKR